MVPNRSLLQVVVQHLQVKMPAVLQLEEGERQQRVEHLVEALVPRVVVVHVVQVEQVAQFELAELVGLEREF